MNKLVIVLGLQNSGSTLMAHTLKYLGVDFGGETNGIDPGELYGGLLESNTIHHHVKERIEKNSVDYVPDKETAMNNIIGMFRRLRARDAACVAVKHSALCWFLEDLWPHLCRENVSIIHCDRDLQNSINGLYDRDKEYIAKADIENYQRSAYARKMAFLDAHKNIPVFPYVMEDFVAQTLTDIEQICLFLDLEQPSSETIDRILKNIKPRSGYSQTL